MLAFFQKAMPVGVVSCSGTPTRPIAPPGTCDLECGDDRLLEADALEHRVGA
jgi:hypothetical protein